MGRGATAARRVPVGGGGRAGVRTHRRIVDHIGAGRAAEAERVARAHLAATQALVLSQSEDGIVDAAVARVITTRASGRL